MLRLFVLVVILGSASPALATQPTERHDQVQADLGLSVIQVAYEHRLAGHLSASLSAGIFGSYFLPWFDLGDNVVGVGAGVRVTWFLRPSGRGFYVAAYGRGHRVTGDHDDMHGSGFGFSTGAFAGWAFGLGKKLDLRTGVGAQFIDHYIDTPAGTSTSKTPFIALDLVVAYRL